MIKLGQKAKDKVTGFTGIITGRATYIYGCDQYSLVPAVKKKDNKMIGGQWFDEGRIVVLGKGINPASVRVKKNGGPNMDAPKTY